MKILFYGAGVIGCTYASLLSEAGYDITLLVKRNRKTSIDKHGIELTYTDFRNKKQQKHCILYPRVVDNLDNENEYNYVIVSTANTALDEVLPILSKYSGKSHILFFQNLWDSDFTKIDKHLTPDRYFFGFPFIVGGGRKMDAINSVISGGRYARTMLGELDGTVSPRIQEISDILKKVNLKPTVSSSIKTWLITHYAVAACLSNGILKAGEAKAFVKNNDLIKVTIKAIQESFHICKLLGYNPMNERTSKLYFLPLWIAIPIARKVYSDEILMMMFDGHIQNKEEIKIMLKDLIQYGERLNTKTKNIYSLEN